MTDAITCLSLILSLADHLNNKISITAIAKAGWFVTPRMDRKNTSRLDWVNRNGTVSATVRPSGVPIQVSITVVSGLVMRSEEKIKACAELHRLDAMNAKSKNAPARIKKHKILKAAGENRPK